MQTTRSIIETIGAPPDIFSPSRMFTVGAPSAPVEVSVAGVASTVGRPGFSVHATPVELHTPTSRLQGIVPLTLEMEDAHGIREALPNILFEVITTAAGEMGFSSERQPGPWGFSLKVSSTARQMSLSFMLNYSGLNVERALEGVRFNQALASGGNLRIYGAHRVTGEALPIVSGSLPPGTYEGPDPRFVKMLEHLVFIQSKTGVSFTVPDRNINFEDVSTVAASAHILETGHAQYKAEPWTSVSNVEQARIALESFAGGEPHPMALRFDGQVVIIFGTHVPLGPVVLFCERTYIAEEDLAALRRDVKAGNSESVVNIRFTPFEGCPIEARYLNWLPEHEAAAILELPIYRKDESAHGEEQRELPPVNINEAVALLESWYDEDAEEQRKTWDSLRVALDEDRLSDRKLFQ